MFYFVTISIAVLVFVIMRFVAGELRRSGSPREVRWGNILRTAAWAVLGIWIAFETVIASIHQIPAGHIGVVYEFGSIRGQIGEGARFVFPWRSVTQANIQVQQHTFDDLDAFSEETQDVLVKATLNYRVSPQAIQKLYREVGPNYFDVLVAPRVEQNFKDETAKYKSVDIAPRREELRHAVSTRLEQELAAWSIEVTDLLLNNIDFRPEFKTAIENKQIATQNALEQEQRVVVAQRQAEQAIKTAEGQGQAILTVAEKQAEANRALSASLSDSLIQYSLVQKLGDKISVIILPSGQNFILDADVLKGSQK